MKKRRLINILTFTRQRHSVNVTFPQLRVKGTAAEAKCQSKFGFLFHSQLWQTPFILTQKIYERTQLNSVITLPKDLRGQSSGQKQSETENTLNTNKCGPGLEYVQEETFDAASTAQHWLTTLPQCDHHPGSPAVLDVTQHELRPTCVTAG